MPLDGNKCAKNLCKRIVLVQLIIENVVTCFFGTQCIYIFIHHQDGSTVDIRRLNKIYNLTNK